MQFARDFHAVQGASKQCAVQGASMQYRGLPCMQGASMQCRGLPRSAWGFHAAHVASPQLHVLPSESSQLLMIGSRHLKLYGQEIYSIFFDLRKAFDSVPHRPLVHVDKLVSLGLDAHTLL